LFKGLCIGTLALVLVACGALKARHGAPQPAEEPAAAVELPTRGKPYAIDANQSELRVLVYRAGPLARFGHNHVMVNRALSGAVSLADATGASAFWLNIPAAGFVVDDRIARAQEGPDFSAEVSDDARSGTLQNMLGAAVLDAAEFPVITVKSIAISAAPGAQGAEALIASVVVSIAGHESTVDAPLAALWDSHQLSVSGSLELRQSALGLTPYSLMLGALQVQDAVTIKFKIVALPG
jgi:hypothetical protein